jgi:mycothiol synthase
MTALTWRAAEHADAAAIADLFQAIATTAPTGLETTVSEVRSRLTAPRLDLKRDSLVAVSAGAAVLAFAEVADMGIGHGRFRIRLTSAIHPEADGVALRRTHRWLLERSQQMRAERHPELPAVLGTRCADTDSQRFALLSEVGFLVAYRHEDLVRHLDHSVKSAAAPTEILVVPYQASLDDAARVTHNEAFASDPSALQPDIATWPEHAVGLPSFLPDASFLAITAKQVAAFLFSLQRRESAGVREAAIHCMGTHPAWRNRGLAALLITHALVAYEKDGFDVVRLQARDSNAAAMRLYHRLGFASSGRGYTVLQAPVAHDPVTGP